LEKNFLYLLDLKILRVISFRQEQRFSEIKKSISPFLSEYFAESDIFWVPVDGFEG